ncbi:MAG: hypothetical protein NVSMB38_37650 [Ktedonobacteraceae bacterium]
MLARLVVLGLIKQQSMSDYEIQHLLQISKTEQWAAYRNNLLYIPLYHPHHILKRKRFTHRIISP